MKIKTITTFATSLLVSTSIAAADSSWLVRLRAIDVIPDASSTTISLIGGQVTDISNTIVPELDFSYFITSNIAAELILATSRHAVKATNTILGTVDLGKVNALPPTLTAQYHFLPGEFFSPYIGAGINFTYFYHVKNGPLSLSTHYGNSVGPALQIGTDIALNDNWSINIDVKKVYMKSDVTVNTVLAPVSTEVKINPLIIGLGVGYRFS